MGHVSSSQAMMFPNHCPLLYTCVAPKHPFAKALGALEIFTYRTRGSSNFALKTQVSSDKQLVGPLNN